MNANLFTKKIEMTKNEAKAAGKIGTHEFDELRMYMEMYPEFTIDIKTTARRKVELRGLDYKYMRNYILCHDDEQNSKMKKFNTLIAQDKKDGKNGAEHLEAASYLDVREWFLSTFPEIKKSRDDHKAVVQAILTEVA